MTFRYSKHGLEGRERSLQRLLEIVPGGLSWAILVGMLMLSFLKPVWAAIFVITFHLYWLLRLLYMTLFLILSYIRLSMERKTDWMALLQALKKDPSIPRLEEIHHLILFPVVRESQEIYLQGVESLLKQQISPKQMTVVLAVEERASAEIKEGALRIAKRYQDPFSAFLVAFHPDGLPGEARVKGANVTYAAKQAAEDLRRRGIAFENVILSCLDADTVLSPQYMGCLTYQFLICPKRTRASFQPIPVYHNNIWEVPGFARVLDVGSSFFQLVEATNPQKLVTFSSHSMSFQALVEVGYWPVDMISDDSAIFWKAFIHYEGDYRVIPMYVTVSMDVAASDDWRKTALNVYRQKRRWAWGVENFPIVMRAFLAPSRISLFDKIRHLAKLFEGHISWATWPFLICVIGWLPAILVGRAFSDTVLYYSAPRITWTIFHLASVSWGTSILLSILLIPKAPAKHPVLRKIGHLMEWLLVPVISIFFSAIPALDAQTRLLLNRHMEFWVTEKKRSASGGYPGQMQPLPSAQP